MRTLGLSLALALAAALAACGKSSSPDVDPLAGAVVTVKGRALVPVAFHPLTPFAEGKTGVGYSSSWSNCSPNGAASQSAVTAGGLRHESTNNCNGPQYVAFEVYQGTTDLTDYASGALVLTFSTATAGMGFTAQLQDEASHASTAVNLADHGFDPAKAGLAQTVTIPLAALATGGVDLTKAKRLLHLVATCPVAQCFATIEKLVVKGGAAPASASLTRGPCKGYSCRPLPRRPIRIVRATQTGWTAAEDTWSTTDANGALTISQLRKTLEDELAEGPTFVGITDDAGLTLLSEVTRDLFQDQDFVAEINVDVDVTTTLVALARCPDGRVGGNCAPDAGGAAHLGSLDATLDAYLEAHPPASDDFPALLQASLSDAQVIGGLGFVVDGAAAAKTFAQSAPPKLGYPAAATQQGQGTGTGTSTGTGPKAPADFPQSLPAGNWTVTAQICADAVGCQAGPTQSFSAADGNDLYSQFAATLDDACKQQQQPGATCTTAYSGYDGTKFTATVTVTVTADGKTATATTTWTFTKG